MAENAPIVPPTPSGGVAPLSVAPPPMAPPKPHESGKVQPKKETVRINLPPKPTAAPTIKIPAPSAIGSAAPAAAAPIAAQAAVPASAGHKPAGAPVATSAAAPKAAAPAASAPARMPRPASGVDIVDKILAIAAIVVALAVGARVFMLSSMFGG